eukprot:g28818.t1
MGVSSWVGRIVSLAVLLASVMAARQDQTKSRAMALAACCEWIRLVLDDRLDELKEKQTEAERKKAAAASALQRKLALVDDRDAMVAVEKAATAHTDSGKAHQDAVEKRDKLSQDVEDLDGKIAEKNAAMMKALQKMKNEIEDLKDQRDKKVHERDTAEQEQLDPWQHSKPPRLRQILGSIRRPTTQFNRATNFFQDDLKGKVMAATKFKVGVEQEQVKAEKAVQEAQQELDELQVNLDNAVTNATVAEGEDTEAADKLRDAKKQAERGERTGSFCACVEKRLHGHGENSSTASYLFGRNVRFRLVPSQGSLQHNIKW